MKTQLPLTKNASMEQAEVLVSGKTTFFRMKNLDLFLEALKNLKTVGTVTASSKYAIRKMLRPIDFSKANLIVEFGAGDGCITQRILEKMKPDATLLSFEINDKFCEVLNEIAAQDRRLHVIKDSAENVQHYLARFTDTAECSHVISALPLSLLPAQVLNNILTASHHILRKGGYFIQIQYSPISYKDLKRYFKHIDLKIAVRNIPPALLYFCYNRPEKK